MEHVFEIYSLIWVAEIIANQRQRAGWHAACWIAVLSAGQRRIKGRKTETIS